MRFVSRAWGIQAHFAGESQIDIICRELGLDPSSFGVATACVRAGPRAPGFDCAMSGCGKRWIVPPRPRAGGNRCRVSPANASGGVWPAVNGGLGGGRGSGAWVKLNEDGTVHLIAGMSEIGSGSSTAMVQIAAEVLGVGADAVALVSGDTETTPFDTLTAASRVTVSVGNAVKRAATDARDQLLQLAAERLGECRGPRLP